MSATTDTTHARKSTSRLAVPTGQADPASPRASTSTARLLWTASSSRNSSYYLQRILDVRQMDIQSALDQMKTLLSVRPQMIYKTAYYRKQTKNHWARDDPAFLLLQAMFLIFACFAYSIAFKANLANSLSFVLASVVWNWLLLGGIVATLTREVANRYLQTSNNCHVRQQVEWLYAFDIHCNSFFPVFVVLCEYQNDTLLDFVFLSPFYMFRRNPILYTSSRSWWWIVSSGTGEYDVWRGVCLVLVYYAFGIPGAPLLGQYRGLFIPHCRYFHSFCHAGDSLPIWLRYQLCAVHGEVLLLVAPMAQQNM